MTISAMAAAKRLCAVSGWSLSNLKMQKLLYLAHMVHLGRTGLPLINGHFEAWEYGPVEPDVYRRARVFGRDPVGNIFHLVGDIPAGTEAVAIDDVHSAYGHAQPGQLVAMTHQNGGAWARYYRQGERGIRIPDEAILQEFRVRTNAAAA
jgi:uncharacterized phage-associated protein